MEPTLFRFDFSRYITLESEIEVSDDLVMLFRMQGPAGDVLLRRFILSEYSPERGFHQTRSSRYERLPAVVADRAEQFNDPGYSGRHEVRQEYFLVNFDPTSLISMNHPVRVTPLKNWNASSFLRIYQVDSRVADPPGARLIEAERPPMEPDFERHYTRHGDDERIRSLAETVTEGRESYYGKVEALVQYLREHYLYSLTPGLAEDGDQLSHFLFESRRGYCSYFAFAMTLMARSLGIPARVAVGFLVDPAKEVLNFYEVRAYQAHAWVEVYFGELGWIEFDPTTDNIAPEQDIRFLLGFDRSRLSSLIEEILNHQEQLVEEQPGDRTVLSRIRGTARELVHGLGVLARLWYVMLPLMYVLAVLALKSRHYLGYLAARLPRTRTRMLFRHSLVLPRSLGWSRRPDESLLEYARRLDAERGVVLEPWVEHYLEAVFSPVYGGTELRRALQLHRRFLASLRRRVPLWRRLVAVMGPLGGLQTAHPVREHAGTLRGRAGSTIRNTAQNNIRSSVRSRFRKDGGEG